jgi:hypothetical protein
VHHFETAFGETLVRGFLLENLLELDLAFERAGRFSIWGQAQVVLAALLERVCEGGIAALILLV